VPSVWEPHYEDRFSTMQRRESRRRRTRGANSNRPPAPRFIQ